MKILFTGGSSFTGFWFIKELALNGHDVTACFQQASSTYQGIRKKRVERVLEYCKPIFECSFGSASFMKMIAQQQEWNLFCHHAADVTNYKSPDFDPLAATAKNTKEVKAVLEALTQKGCKRMILTGSIFEPHEGVGSEPIRAVSPYGLSKGLTSSIFEYYTGIQGMKLGKFVIPNPFGPFEEVRYTTFLIQSWYQKKIPLLNTPEQVRDNIHVSLLAKAYRWFCQRVPLSEFEKFHPSGYVESQKAFTSRFSSEINARLKLEGKFECTSSCNSTEPKVRINCDALNIKDFDWNEEEAWNQLAEYYEETYAL